MGGSRRTPGFSWERGWAQEGGGVRLHLGGGQREAVGILAFSIKLEGSSPTGKAGKDRQTEEAGWRGAWPAGGLACEHTQAESL